MSGLGGMSRLPRVLRILPVLLVLLMTGALWQATPAFGKDLLAEVSGRLSDAPAIRGKFEQTRRIAGFSQPLVSHGDFLLVRERGVAWHTRQPVASSLLLGPDFLEVRGADGKVQQRVQADSQPGMRAMLETVLAVLRADAKTLSQRFRVSGAVRGAQGWRLQLTPVEPALARLYSAIELEGDRFVRHVTLREASGDGTTIRLTEVSVADASAGAELRHD